MRKKKNWEDDWETKDLDDDVTPIKKLIDRDNKVFLDLEDEEDPPISADGTELRVQGFSRKQQDLVERIVDMELRNQEREYNRMVDEADDLSIKNEELEGKLRTAKSDNAKLRGKIAVLEAKLKAQAVKHEQELANLRGIDAHIHVRRPQMKPK